MRSRVNMGKERGEWPVIKVLGWIHAQDFAKGLCLRPLGNQSSPFVCHTFVLRLLSTGRNWKWSAATNSCPSDVLKVFFYIFFSQWNLLIYICSTRQPRLCPHHDTFKVCHGVNRFLLSIFSIMIVHMPPIANSQPSEVQQCAVASQLARLLIWKPPSKYGVSSKNTLIAIYSLVSMWHRGR